VYRKKREEEYIKVRVLNHDNLENHKSSIVSKIKKIFKKEYKKEYKNSIIIHIHGGGFISMSSGSH